MAENRSERLKRSIFGAQSIGASAVHKQQGGVKLLSAAGSKKAPFHFNQSNQISFIND